MRRVVGVLLVGCVLAFGVSPAEAEDGAYAPPVDRPVVDGWRPPADPYGPGNRGIDYGTEPGEVVRASADGKVVFAGRIGPDHHVVVLHPDGVRTSYSFLADVLVRRGDVVVRGQPVGRAGSTVHFGARVGDRYIDPTQLLHGHPEVHLIPVEERGAGSIADERRGLVEGLLGLAGGALRASSAGVAWARDAGARGVDVAVTLAETAAVIGWERLRVELQEVAVAAETVFRVVRLPLETMTLWRRGRWFRRDQEGCTPADRAPPPPPPSPRIAVLVAGFGSAGGQGSVLDVDTRALGYADDHVAQFSYRGGQAPGRRRLAGVDVNDYDPADSAGDLGQAGARLRELLDDIGAVHPGVPVDLIAHSQGGIVVRAALGAKPSDLPRIDNVVTLGSPHHGADAATAAALLGPTTTGAVVGAGVSLATGGATDLDAVAIVQLAEDSSFIDDLDDQGLPWGIRFTSIAASGDVVVPALQSGLDEATNVIVPVDGFSAHGRLPGSPEAHREMALALAGMGPTCRGIDADVRLATGISVTEDLVGTGVGLGSLLFDVP